MKRALLAPAMICISNIAVSGSVAVVKQTHSQEGLTGVTATQSSNVISYSLGANYLVGDIVSFTFSEGALSPYTSFPSTIALSPSGSALSLLNSDANSVSYRVTSITGDTLGDSFSLGGAGYYPSAVIAGAITVTVSSATSTGSALDSSGTRTATLAQASTQFGSVSVGSTFDGSIDNLPGDSTAFNGATTDVLTWRVSNPVTTGWLNLASVNPSGGTKITIQGEPGKMTGLKSVNFSTSGTLSLDVSAAKIDTYFRGLVTTDTLTFTPPIGSPVTLAAQAFTISATYNWTSAGGVSGSTSPATGLTAGSWTLASNLPVITSTAVTTIDQDNAYSYTLTASDADTGDTLTLSAPLKPSWLSFTSGTGILTGTPSSTDAGVHNVTLRVNDGSQDVDQIFIITVEADLDGDGTANRLDSDDDGDGIPDTNEGSVDTDSDGTIDSLDTDSDNDGIPDLTEGNIDSDNDGIPDYLDGDSDGDGISDLIEGATDTDGDGTMDYLDTSKDYDGDGIPDIVEGTVDTDNDGTPNYKDTDSDNDSLTDTAESPATGTDTDNDGIDDAYDVTQTGGTDGNGDGIDDNIAIKDTDQDAIADRLDVDSDNDGIPDLIEGKLDSDNDGTPDYLDVDSDNDGISDATEANVSTLDTDSDGIDDSYDVDQVGGVDANNDGIADSSSLPDLDNDGVADLRDLDSDNDGLFDTQETGVIDVNKDGIADVIGTMVSVIADSDNDGIADFRDLDSNGDGVNDIQDSAAKVLDLNGDGKIDITFDADHDGIDDSVDEQSAAPGSVSDGDGDGVPSKLDKDQDGDGIPDMIEGTNDTDNDGIKDFLDRDSDNDGLSDAFEANIPAPSGADGDLDGIDDTYDVSATGGNDINNDGVNDLFSVVDTDGDGKPDYKDTDSDNDNISDTQEQLLVSLSGIDSDSDGIDNAVDVNATGGIDANNDGVDDATMSLSDEDGDGLKNFRDTDSDNDGITDTTSSGDKSGGGGIGWLSLLLMMPLFIVRRKKRD